MSKYPDYLVREKVDFINEYADSKNAASGSKNDPNANVTTKNMATLEYEMVKDLLKAVNVQQIVDEIASSYGKGLAEEFVRQMDSHEIYLNDSTSLKPYCASITMYPFLLDGLTKLGGESKAPKHLESFCGSFINLVYATSAQFAGAVATVEFFMYFDHFARKDYGDDYMNSYRDLVKSQFQHIVYTINQPATARGYQSVFWNVSVYDEFYFKSMFQDFVFPDGDRPKWETIRDLQEYFLSWFNEERTKAVLTFPVVTAALLTENEEPKDKRFLNTISKEMSEGNSFFVYMSDNADSLSSCCRLRNEVSDNTFSYTLGAGGVSTGSINVITLNVNRIIQSGKDLSEEVRKVQKYQIAYRKIIERYYEQGLLTVYSAGFISLKKQYLTLGLNGLVEAAEYLGYVPGNNPEYIGFLQETLKTVYDENVKAKKETGYLFNTEIVPGESLGVKNLNWDKSDGFLVKDGRVAYNSYFYPVEDDSVNVVDKFVLHGKDVVQFLDGGSALHLNLEQYLTKESFEKLIRIAAKTGTNYFCTNVKITVCRDCSNIDKSTNQRCPSCGSGNVDHATRIIGYLKTISSFSEDRQKEAAMRHYHAS